ncbi:hypothetical protein ASF88_01395 [Leifsonia sp. Leaf336]|uniref:hypothetical protein n=1 Tax=Leifsonia sp. Leaf336 TaxID=1736341 RepID=UPI0006FD2691|nr:hypothetical protein [Leifsonia sp. Leaf336]KQR53556.1 hypothetical protein ASF88_01395 [Leifsonia sp. Leaf336]
MRSAGGPVRRVVVAAALAVALGLSGCAAGSEYSPQTASTLQHGVLEVATAAHANDLAGAQTKLAALAKLNDAALAKGEISGARHAAINTSIVAVRADLTQLQDQAEKTQLQQQLQQLQQQQQQQKDQKDKGHGKGKSGSDGDG